MRTLDCSVAMNSLRYSASRSLLMRPSTSLKWLLTFSGVRLERSPLRTRTPLPITLLAGWRDELRRCCETPVRLELVLRVPRTLRLTLRPLLRPALRPLRSPRACTVLLLRCEVPIEVEEDL